MNTRKQTSAPRVLLAILVSLGLIACGGGNMLAPSPDSSNIQPQPPAHDEQVNGGNPGNVTEQRSTNVLAIETPVLSGMPAGAEFEVKLSARFTQEVHQGSFRLLFDPSVMQPIGSTRGGMLKDDMVQLCGLEQPGFVPFSFTALPGDPSIESGEGELLRVRFRLLTQPANSPRVRLLNDAAFLQIRDHSGARLLFDLETSTGGAQ